jgi:DNA-directed RNA polymerase specialized sigma24 family protein
MVAKRDRAMRWVGQDLEQTAESAVWKALSRALGRLEPASRELLREFFAGTAPSELAQRRSLPLADVERWLQAAKAALQRELRRGVRVKN